MLAFWDLMASALRNWLSASASRPVAANARPRLQWACALSGLNRSEDWNCSIASLYLFCSARRQPRLLEAVQEAGFFARVSRHSRSSRASTRARCVANDDNAKTSAAAAPPLTVKRSAFPKIVAADVRRL